MLRIAAALLCAAAGQVFIWLIASPGVTRSPLWAVAEVAGALAIIWHEVRRQRSLAEAPQLAEAGEGWRNMPPPGGQNDAGKIVDLRNWRDG